MVLAIAVPIMIQNGITNLVSLLDNVMVGRLGTEAMSGAAIVNQLFFIYNLCVFGCVSGAGIFTAQYYGQNNQEGIRYTFRYKLWMSLLITVVAIMGSVFFGSQMIQLYLQGEGTQEALTATLHFGKQYLNIILVGLFPFMLTQVYASTLRECGETVLPMKAGACATLVNLVLNYILIYGKFGAPALGVAGAAIATVISRFVEAGIVIYWTHRHKEQNPYIVEMYHSLKVPWDVTKRIFVKGTPLMLNEALWGIAIAALAQCYSVRGLNVVAGMNIAITISNLFNIVYIALGDAIAIIIGRLLGAGRPEEAKDTDNKMIAFSVLCCIGVAVVIALLAPVFPYLYNTSQEARKLATDFILITALFLPQVGFLHASYFTLRSGGKTIVTFFVDSGFIWCVSVTLAFCLSRFTDIPVVTIYFLVNLADALKGILMYYLVKKNVWLQNIVDD